jgi:hypothetical protein
MFVPAVGVAADTATESSATVEPASATARYQEGDRVRVGPGGIVGTVEAVYSAAIDVAWDDGRVQTRDFDSIEFVERPAPRPEPVAEVAAPPPVPTYTRLDEDDGEIDGGAVTLRAETSHGDLPAEDEAKCKHHRAANAIAAYLGGLLRALDEPSPECVDADADDAAVVGHALGCQIHKRLTGEAIPEPSLLGMAQQSRIQQLEAEIDAMRTPSLVPGCEPQRRRIAVLEDQIDASREEVAALNRRLTDALAERDILSREAAASAADARRSRDTLRGALDLIGRLGPA